jgi:hypothetical protein
VAEEVSAHPAGTVFDLGLPGGAERKDMFNLVKTGTTRRNVFGDFALVLFLLAQASDGVLTYVGVATYGTGIEANPLIAWLMAQIGHGPALATAKMAAATFGVALHLISVHKAVAALAVFYFAVAVVPWISLLFTF